jgi:hypothetical protein
MGSVLGQEGKGGVKMKILEYQECWTTEEDAGEAAWTAESPVGKLCQVSVRSIMDGAGLRMGFTLSLCSLFLTSLCACIGIALLFWEWEQLVWCVVVRCMYTRQDRKPKIEN